ASTLTESSAAFGTPHYMAPEQMRSARDVDARADIWSLGAVLYGLCAGAPPFPGETMVAVYDRILGGTPSPRAARPQSPARLAEGREEIVERCRRIGPAQRSAHVGELAAALSDVAAPADRAPIDRILRIAQDFPPVSDSLDDGSLHDGDRGSAHPPKTESSIA